MKNKKILRRIFALLIAVVIACSSFATVGAATSWSSGSRGSTSYGIYWKKALSYSYTDAQGKTQKVSYSTNQGFRVHFFAKSGETLDFTNNKQRAFCIEPEKGVELTGDGSYTTNTDFSGVDAYNKKLSTAQQKVLNYVLAFGYGNYKSYTKPAYWYATQLLVYETAAGIRKTSDFTVASGKTAIKPTTYLGRNSGAEVGSIDTVQDAYDNIVGWVQKALKTPSGTSTSTSNAPTYSMSYDANKKMYTYTYKDSNKILRTTYKDSGDASEKYSKQNLKSSDITVSDTNVSVSIDTAKETITFTSKKALTSPVRVTIKNAYLRGASEMSQDKLSIAVVKGDSSLQAFARGANVTVTSAYFNLTVPIKLQLLKSSANTDITDNNNCYSLEGAKYNIYTDKSCNDSGYFSYITTDADGYGRYGTATDTNTDAKDKDTVAYKKVSGRNIELKSGVAYYAKEIEAPPGYDLDDTVYTFKDSGSISSDGVKIYRAYSDEGNQPTDNPINDPVGIILQKKNAVTGETTNQGLEDAIFEVQYYAQEIDKDYDVDTSKGDAEPTLDSANLKRTWYIKTDSDGYSILTNDTNYFVDNTTYNSDELFFDNGFVTIPVGTVVIAEVKEPDGYTKSPIIFYRQISEEKAKLAQATGTPINIPVDEQPANGYIGIHKMNKSCQGVQGAVYGLYSNENATALVSQLTTDADGKGTFNYSAKVNQTYYIKEISAPTGYSLDTTIYPVTPTSDNATVDTAVVQDIYEDSVKGDIIIKKSSNDGIVSNIYFALSDNLGNTHNAVATDSTGTAKYTGLPVYDSSNNKIKYTVKELGFKTTPGKKSYGGFTWTVKSENCIKYKGAYYEGIANNTFSDCEYAYSRYYYGSQTEAVKNSNGYTKTLTANSSVTYSFNNTVKTSDIEISKQSYDGRRSGFWFNVVDQTGKNYGTIVTGDNGIAKYSEQNSKPLYSCITVPNSAITLRIKYRVEELGFRTPGGDGSYYFPDTYTGKQVSEYKSDDLSASTAITYDVYNKPDTGNINIVKTSDDDYIEGLCFEISAYEDMSEYTGEIYDTEIGYDSNGKAIHSFVVQTDSNGKASSNSLVFYDVNGNKMSGLPVYVLDSNDTEITYKITELGLKASDGTYYLPNRYKKNDDVSFNLLDNRSHTYTCHNSVKNGKLQIQKTSEDNEVEDIWFKVESNLGYAENFVTDSTGFTDEITDLPIYVPATDNNELVTYKVTELGYSNGDGTYSLPSKYVTPKAQTVTLNTDGTVKVVHINNTLKRGSVTLYKEDSDGNALAGSQWGLYNASDDSFVSLKQTGNGIYQYNEAGKVVTLDTDNNGRLKVSNLKQGDYYFIEKTSPAGKMTYGRKIEFTISADSAETLNLTRTAKDNAIVMYNTGGNGNYRFHFYGFTMLAISIAVIVIYTIKSRRKHGKI